MSFDPISDDAPQIDYDFPTATAGLTFAHAGVMLHGHVFVEQGQGPHPTVLVLHGFPGIEQNFDIAHAVRRAGWNAVIFHYRGSWGSGGDYSFQYVLEDTAAAVNFLISDESVEKYRIDPARFVLVGHSLGGFAALMTASQNEHVKAVGSLAGANLGSWAKFIAGKSLETAYLVEGFHEDTLALQGTSGKALVKEMFSNREAWDLNSLPPKLLSKPVLLIAGSRDTAVVPELHHDPLVQAFQTTGHSRFEAHILDADHSFNDKRITLARIVVGWLVGLPGKETFKSL